MRKYWNALDNIYGDVVNQYSINPNVKSFHGAIVFYRHKAVAWGMNQPDRSVTNNVMCFSIHAEVDAFMRCIPKHRERASEILVFRCRRDGKLANSRCCSGCLSFLKKTNIRKVIFTNDHGDLEVHRIEDLNAELDGPQKRQYQRNSTGPIYTVWE